MAELSKSVPSFRDNGLALLDDIEAALGSFRKRMETRPPQIRSKYADEIELLDEILDTARSATKRQSSIEFSEMLDPDRVPLINPEPTDALIRPDMSARDDVPAEPTRTFGGQAKEVVKGIPASAAALVAGGIRGLAGLDPIEAFTGNVAEWREDLARVPEMSDTELADLRKRVQDLPPASRNAVQSAISDLLDGGMTSNELREAFPDATPVSERPLYKAGETAERFVRENVLPPAPGYEDSIGRQLGEGLGSVAGGVVLSAIMGPVAAAAVFAAAGSGEAVDRAIMEGATEDQILQAAKAGLIPGMTDSLPIETLLGRVPIPGVGLIKLPKGSLGHALKAVGRIGYQAFVEGVQEGGQQFLQNFFAKEIYKPDQELSEGVVPAAGLGAGVGGLAEAVATPFRKRSYLPPKPDPEATDEELAETFDRVVEAHDDINDAIDQGIIEPPEARPVDNEQALSDAGFEIIDEMLDTLPRSSSLPAPADTVVDETPVGQTDPEPSVGATTIESDGQASKIVEVSGQPVAAADLRVSDEEVRINNVMTLPEARRQGHATRLVDNLFDEFPDRRISVGTLTEDGTAFFGDRFKVSQDGFLSRRDGSREAPATDVETASIMVEEPTPAQADAGNYQKGHLRLHGLDISIETPEGGIRRGKTPDGTEWSVEMPAAYGYVKRTEGADGDHVDVYVGPDQDSEAVFVVDQIEPETGLFDEHKAILGATDTAAAQAIYEGGFSDGSGRTRLGAITEMDMPAFRDWLRDGDTKTPLEYRQPAKAVATPVSDQRDVGETVANEAAIQAEAAQGRERPVDEDRTRPDSGESVSDRPPPEEQGADPQLLIPGTTKVQGPDGPKRTQTPQQDLDFGLFAPPKDDSQSELFENPEVRSPDSEQQNRPASPEDVNEGAGPGPREDESYDLGNLDDALDVLKRAGFDIGDGHYGLTQDMQESWDQVSTAVDAVVSKMAPKVRTRIERARGYQGKFSHKLGMIYVSVYAQDPEGTARHEVIHALRSTGLLSDQEFSVLRDAARRLNWRSLYQIDDRYREAYAERFRDAHHMDEALDEEAIGEAFARYRDGERYGSKIDRIFRALADLLEKLRNALNGLGFQSAEDVFRRIERGEVGARSGQPVDADVDRKQTRAVRLSKPSSSSTEVFLDAESLREIGLPEQNARLFVDFDKLLRKRESDAERLGYAAPFKSIDDVRAHVVSVLANWQHRFPGRDPSNIMLVYRADQNRNVIVRVEPKGSRSPRYEIVSAYVLSDEQFERREAALRTSTALPAALRGSAEGPLSGSEESAPASRDKDNPSDDDFQYQLGNDWLNGFRGLNPFQAKANRDPAADFFNEDGTLKRLRSLQRKFQDQFLPVKAVQRIVAGARQLPDRMDAYLKEEMYHRRVQTKMEDLRDKVLEPLIDEMAKAKVSEPMLEAFLYAKHAPKRNEHIASINARFPDGGSGMTNAEAQEILAAFEADGLTTKLEKLASYVYRAQEMKLAGMVENGLLSEKSADDLRSRFGSNYVPLKNLDVSDRDWAPALGISRGFSVGSSGLKEALGRASKADGILANTIADYRRVLVGAEKNRVMRAFYDFASENPEGTYYKVDPVKLKRVLVKRPGPRMGDEIEVPDFVLSQGPETVDAYVRDPMAFLDRKTLPVMVDGERKSIRIENDSLYDALAMTHSAPDLSVLQAINGVLARLFTQWNPAFVIPNFTRDIQAAGFVLSAEDGTKQARKVVGSAFKAMAGIASQEFGKGKGKWAQAYRDLEKVGGLTGWSNVVRDVTAVHDEIDLMLRTAAGKANPLERAKKFGHQVDRFAEKANAIFENAVRVSVYQAMLDQGQTKERAASAAKNITVNFNRRGTNRAMAALYLFFNAAIQGNARMLMALVRGKHGKQVLGGLIAAGAVHAGLNMMLGALHDDDEENLYMQIPDYVRENNWVLLNPFGRDEEGQRKLAYISAPAPYGFSFFTNLGRRMMEYAGQAIAPDEFPRGGKSLPDLAIDTFIGGFTHAFESFSPIGSHPNPAAAASPTAVKPFVELFVNENFTGNRIIPPSFDQTEPNWKRFYPSTPGLWRDMAELLSDVSGGDAIVPGRVDVSPEALEHLYRAYTGGLGSFLSNTFDLVLNPSGPLWGPQRFTFQDAPIIRRFLSSDRATIYADQYYAIDERMRRFEQATRDARKGDQDARAWVRERDVEPRLFSLWKGSREQIKRLRIERGRLEGQRLPSAEKARRLENIFDLRALEYRRLVRMHNLTEQRLRINASDLPEEVKQEMLSDIDRQAANLNSIIGQIGRSIRNPKTIDRSEIRDLVPAG